MAANQQKERVPRGRPSYIFITGLLAALILVGTVGLFSFRSLKEMVVALREESKPQLSRISLEEVLYQLSSLQSGVRAFSNTTDTAYLDAYEATRTSVDSSVTELAARLMREGKTGVADTIRQLVLSDFDALDSIVIYASSDLVDKFYTDVKKGLTEARKKTDTKIKAIDKSVVDANIPVKKEDPSVEIVEESGFLKRIFGGKKDKKTENDAPSETESSTGTPTHSVMGKDGEERMLKVDAKSAQEKNSLVINDSLLRAVEARVIRARQRVEGDRQQRDEILMEYTRREDHIMKSLQGLLKRMEQEKLAESEERVSEADAKTGETTTIISFLIIIAILLLTLSSLALMLSFFRIRKFNWLLAEEKAKALAIAEQRERFLNVMSHEMRNPLNAISGFSRELSEAELTGRQARCISMISVAATHLTKVVDEVLEDARLESGKMGFERQPFSPCNELQKVAALLEQQRASEEVEVKVNIPHNFPNAVLGDAFRMRQILLNLGGNAVKFTSKGSVTLSCDKVEEEGDIVRGYFSVSDTGVGIPAENLANIFEPFIQADSSVSRKFGGTGLGLSITKKLVESLGGTISVESKIKEGTTFYFSLPFARTNEELRPEVASVQGPNLLFSGRKALLVDDEQYNRELFNAQLSRLGLQVTLAETGEKALECAEKEPFDVVLMDVRMPGMGGIEATRALKSTYPAMKVILLTAGVDQDTTAAATGAGADSILFKPIDSHKLAEALSHWMEPGNPMEWDESDLEAEEESQDGLDVSRLMKISGGDKGFVVKMLETYVEGLEEAEANIRTFIEQGQWKQAAVSAHRATASSRHLGLTEIAIVLKKIEQQTDDQAGLESVMDSLQEFETKKKKAKFIIHEKVMELKS